jgi:hypothetical protein
MRRAIARGNRAGQQLPLDLIFLKTSYCSLSNFRESSGDRQTRIFFLGSLNVLAEEVNEKI